jgi:hypothetical protein
MARAFTELEAELEVRLIQTAGHAMSKVIEVYKRQARTGEELKRLKAIEGVCQGLEVLLLWPARRK